MTSRLGRESGQDEPTRALWGGSCDASHALGDRIGHMADRSAPDQPAKGKVLVVDDDASLSEMLAIVLRQEGFDSQLVSRGDMALPAFHDYKPDVVLLDLMLPGMDGIEVCKQIRKESGVPIVMLTAKGDTVDVVVGLESGADDYVVKPFGTRELLARIRAVLRRTAPDAKKVLHFGDVEVDLERRLVFRKTEDVRMTPAEYNLLVYFLQNPDRPLTRDMILNSVWGYESFPNTRTVDAHVVKLRQKLEPDPSAPRHFLTVHGVGYRFLP